MIKKLKKFKVLTKAQLMKMRGGKQTAGAFTFGNGCRMESCAGNCVSAASAREVAERKKKVDAFKAEQEKAKAAAKKPVDAKATDAAAPKGK